MNPDTVAGSGEEENPNAYWLSGFTPRMRRSWGEAIGDTGLQLAQGVVNVAGAVPSLVAPDSRLAQGMQGAAQSLQGRQSAPMQRQMAQAEEETALAEADSPWEQGWAALRANLRSPALAARLVTTNLPSMVPVLGAARAAQGATLAGRMAAGPLSQAGGCGLKKRAGGSRRHQCAAQCRRRARRYVRGFAANRDECGRARRAGARHGAGAKLGSGGSWRCNGRGQWCAGSGKPAIRARRSQRRRAHGSGAGFPVARRIAPGRY